MGGCRWVWGGRGGGYGCGCGGGNGGGRVIGVWGCVKVCAGGELVGSKQTEQQLYYYGGKVLS